MKFLSVYSGIGMHDLGFERAGMECVGQIEIDPYCRAVLEKHWPGLPRWSDVRDVTTEIVRRECGRIDMLTGGFSCRDVSVAGKARGIARETESGITWRNFFRLARGLRPILLVIENVPRLRTLAADRILAALERIGYACRSFVVGAIHVGAAFVGQRVWIVAATGGAGLSPGWEISLRAERLQPMPSSSGAYRRVAGTKEPQNEWEKPRLVEPSLGVATDDASRRLARFASERAIHALGNGNPPQIAEMIGRAILRAT